jgi:hypothetical protein
MHMLWRQVVRAESRGADAIKFCDELASDECLEALQEVGFVAGSNGWVKRLHRTNYTLDDIVSGSAGTRPTGLQSPVGEAVCHLASVGTPDAFAEAERIVWPSHIRNSGLPCYIVPIQPRWAGALFDSSIAAEHLFPSDPSRLLRFENVYYRSAKPEILSTTPARVLWYVSDADTERHSKQIRASSLIKAVETDTAKNVFRRYRRFGVFDWEHVRALGRSSNGPVMAFSFSHTTLLKRPISFADVSSLLKARLGKTYTFQSPVELPEDVWIELHELANK